MYLIPNLLASTSNHLDHTGIITATGMLFLYHRRHTNGQAVAAYHVSRPSALCDYSGDKASVIGHPIIHTGSFCMQVLFFAVTCGMALLSLVFLRAHILVKYRLGGSFFSLLSALVGHCDVTPPSRSLPCTVFGFLIMPLLRCLELFFFFA